MITCICDLCKREIPFDWAANWRARRDVSHFGPGFEELDVCQDCEETAYRMSMDEHDKARKQANEIIQRRIKAMFK